jgi:hypothetical protein
LIAAVGAGCLAGGARDGLRPAPPTASVGAVAAPADGLRLGHGPGCLDLRVRASVAPLLAALAGATPARSAAALELVVSVDAEVCHREAIPAGATAHGELAALCPGAPLLRPGPHQVEVALVSSGCGAARRPARLVATCEGPAAD